MPNRLAMPNPLDDATEYLSQTFVGLDLSNETLSFKEFDGCVFNECRFDSVTFKNCKFIECEFVSCNLSVVNINYSRFMDVTFNQCKIIGVDWTKASWPNLSLPAPIAFHQSLLNDSSFYGLLLADLIIEGCTVHDVDFREGNFHQGDFSGSDFSNSLFNGANLSGVSFEDAENYYIDLNHTNIKQAKFSRLEAVCLLESLDIELLD